MKTVVGTAGVCFVVGAVLLLVAFTITHVIGLPTKALAKMPSGR